MKTIVLDAFGGDYAPEEIVKGALLGLEKYKDIQIILCGDEKKIAQQLDGQNYDKQRLIIRHASEIIETSEEPVKAIRRKKDSSLSVALRAVAEKEAQVLISSGSTGAVLAGATLIVGRIKGVKRPALAPLIPTVKGGNVMLIDCGANVDSKPAYLEQFALMGSVYMQQVMGIDMPKVGLLNNGAEAEKGNDLTKHSYPLLQEADINFVGNCEPRYAMTGDYDVIVADGFAGNVLLKSIEGTAMSVMKMLKEELMSDGRSKIGALLAKPAFGRMKDRMDYEAVGGALLLGIDGGIIKTHGNAKAKAIVAAIGQACQFIDGAVVERISQSLAKINDEEA